MSYGHRLVRAHVMDALDARVRQFRTRDELTPFRVPHEPLDLDAIIADALADAGGRLDAASLRARTVVRLEWDDGGSWDAWAINLPSGVFLYCDSDGHETRVLASVKRGSAEEADRFFLELLAESSGEYFGIEMAGGAPDRVRTFITDREFLSDVFVELFEDTPVERAIHRLVAAPAPRDARAPDDGRDFRADVERWLNRVLITPTPARTRRARRRPKRLRDDAAH